MKGILEFDLPTEQDAFRDAQNGTKWESAVNSLRSQLQAWAWQKADWGDTRFPTKVPTKTMQQVVPVILEELNRTLKEHGLTPE